MESNFLNLLKKLEATQSLSVEEYEVLIRCYTPETAKILAMGANRVRQQIYGRDVYIRGLIEISNICRNDCYYCGIRAGNGNCDRYRLTEEEILGCCAEGYELGFRTFVMQGGEDGYYDDDRMCHIIRQIRSRYPDCAITLSLGERSRESYQRLFDAGADRYLLRHETANPQHYAQLHPEQMSFQERMDCLRDLKDIGYQVGCGFMVGSPGQTTADLARDLKFIEEFSPDMCGIGPFIPHGDTPFREEAAGDAGLTCYLLSMIRLACPHVLLPATTALGTIRGDGREQGVLSGANVVMPNLSPASVRAKYALYDGKLSSGAESAQCVADLQRRMEAIGYQVVFERGDVRR